MPPLSYRDIARQVFESEAAAIAGLSLLLDEGFDGIVEGILKCTGKLVVCGVGKSGIVGRKISATLASTGTPSFFLHPTEAFHGDLGMLRKEDMLLFISYSGETEEILRLLPIVKGFGIKTIGLSGNPQATLALHCDHHLNVAVAQEACPLLLAPTSSTTATLAMGDALAVALMYARDFQPEDFARFHPGGSLGRRLLTTVESIMRKEKLPIILPETPMKTVIHSMTAGKLGLAIVQDGTGKLLGIITDGDLRRAMDKWEQQLFAYQAHDIMTRSPRCISPQTKMAEAEQIMTEHHITSLLVVEDGRLLGVVQLYQVNL